MAESREKLDALASVISSFLNNPKSTFNSYEYAWSVGNAARNSLPVSAITFDWAEYDQDTKTGNKNLRHHLSEIWQAATDSEKNALANWIVKDWGGIKGNKPKTIQAHIDLIESDDEIPLKGIASSSKILSIKAPETFAIYDARVAAALNAIQICIDSEQAFQPLHFPYLDSRNSKITAFCRVANKSMLLENGFSEVTKKHVYQRYLSLLHKITNRLNTNRKPEKIQIIDIEMYLFSEAEALCDQAQTTINGQWNQTGNTQ